MLFHVTVLPRDIGHVCHPEMGCVYSSSVSEIIMTFILEEEDFKREEDEKQEIGPPSVKKRCSENILKIAEEKLLGLGFTDPDQECFVEMNYHKYPREAPDTISDRKHRASAFDYMLYNILDKLAADRILQISYITGIDSKGLKLFYWEKEHLGVFNRRNPTRNGCTSVILFNLKERHSQLGFVKYLHGELVKNEKSK